MVAGKTQSGIGQLSGQMTGRIGIRRDVAGMEPNEVVVRDNDPAGIRVAGMLHRTFDPSLDLDGLDRRPEQPCPGTLEEALEELFNGSKSSHLGAGV